MEELIECICDYVRKPYTDYAIMINGEWGSGKTYFWNNKLRNRLESISVNGKNYKTIYMSLYGINSLEEISKKIFIETNPMISKSLKKFVDNRHGNSIPEYVKTGLDMANLFGNMSYNTDKLDFSKLFAIDDKILCFDDLERANVDVIDILGYINNFVEHDGIKTILICNEKELATKFKNTNKEFKTFIASYILDKEGNLVTKEEKKLGGDKTTSKSKPLVNLLEDKISSIFDTANDYERIKEKLIGETFEYVPEYAYILSGMIMKYAYNEELTDFYKRNTHLIISTFKKSNTRNLRILKHSLNDFEKIFNEVKYNYPDTPVQLLKNMLIFTIAVSFEIKAGNISKEKLKAIDSNEEYDSIIFTSKILNENNQFYLREFDNKYFFNMSSGYRFFKFIEIYIRTRFFDEKVFKENMEEALTAPEKKEKEEKALKYKTILSGEYFKLSDTDFDILWKQVLDEVKEGKVAFKEHVKLYAIFKSLINMGLIEIDGNDLKQKFILGMQISSLNSPNLEEDKIDFDIDFNSSEKDIEEIKQEYIRIKETTIQELATTKAEKLFKLIPSDIQEFYRLILSEFSTLPVFSRYDMDDLYDKLDLTQNYDLYNIVNMLQERYKDNKDLFVLEYKNLKRLSDIIILNNNTKNKTMKQVLLMNISKAITDLSHKYNVRK